METKAPQEILKHRKLTHWQENFARYIFQETGYVPDLQTLKLAMLLQKAYRNSPWNKARLSKSEEPAPLPDLPYVLDEIRAHLPATPAAVPVAGITKTQGAFIEKSVSEWGALKAEMGPFFEHRMSDPLVTVFEPEPGPDAELLAKLERKIDTARNKAGRRRPTAKGI